MKRIHLLLTVIFLFSIQIYIHSQGTRYTGPYTPSAAIDWHGISNQEISGLSFTNLNRTSIALWECTNITIKNCKFSKSAYKAISTENSKNVTIMDCVFDSVADGVFANSNKSNPFNNGTSSGVKVVHNYFRNIMGGWPRHHAVIFASVSGGGGNQINYNSFENIHLQSFVDDIISVYNCYGSVNDSIQIIGNWLRGGDYNPENHTGSGITFGDNGGSYIHVKNNILVNIVSGGIGNAGANHTIVENNIIYQSKELANPSNSADGYIMFNFNPVPSEADCYDNTWRNNRGLYLTNSGADHTYIALNYPTNNCTNALEIETNIVDRSLNASILPQNISRAKEITTESSIKAIETNFKFYPNPANDHFTVESSTDVNNGVITIFNLSGQKLIEQNFNSQFTEISTNNFAVGVYIVKVTSGGKEIENKKLIINKN